MTHNRESEPIYRNLLISGCRLAEGIKAQVVDHDDRPLPYGKAGLIRFRGGAVSGGFGESDAAQWPFRDGWLYPGDLATLSVDGQVVFKGPSDDVMEIDQTRFFSADTEGALLAHPNVTAAAAFAWRNQAEVVAAAAVTTSAPVEFDELVALCREQVAEYKVPKFILYVPEMPRDRKGRIDKGKIREILVARPSPPSAERMASSESTGWKSGEDVLIEMPNYVIRSLKAEDVSDRMLEWWADPEIVAPLRIQHGNYARDDFAEFVSSFNNEDRFLLGIFVRETGLHIGWWEVDFNPDRRVAVLDLAIGDKSFQGRRIIDEMRDAFSEFLFDGLGVYRIEAKIYVDNFRSRRLAESSGYEMEAILASDELATDGERRDMALYRRYANAWREQRDGQTANP